MLKNLTSQQAQLMVDVSKYLLFQELKITDATKIWHVKVDKIVKGKYAGLDLLGMVYSTLSPIKFEEPCLQQVIQLKGAKKLSLKLDELIRHIHPTIRGSYGNPYILEGGDLICFYNAWQTANIHLEKRAEYWGKGCGFHMRYVKESLELIQNNTGVT